jgi:hypothetical protein
MTAWNISLFPWQCGNQGRLSAFYVQLSWHICFAFSFHIQQHSLPGITVWLLEIFHCFRDSVAIKEGILLSTSNSVGIYASLFLHESALLPFFVFIISTSEALQTFLCDFEGLHPATSARTFPLSGYQARKYSSPVDVRRRFSWPTLVRLPKSSVVP